MDQEQEQSQAQISQHDTIELKVRDDNGIRVDALHLKEYGSGHITLLHDITLNFPKGSFVALVGSSGVGKTTLLNAISGIRPAQKGTVLYDGKDYYRYLGEFSDQIGYVPQDDIIHKNLSVKRALYYSARLRLPEGYTRRQIRWRINAVLDEVEMSHRRNHLVGRLSGGERKRVSLALELLGNPRIFLLDEPTAGLDPGLDLKMMRLLRKLADRGHTIILVTHATRNIDVCDLVCFMAQGGRLAFYGTPTEAQEYFHTTNFAEIYNALEPTAEHKNIPKKAEERYKQSPYYTRHITDPLDNKAEEQEQQPEQTAAAAPHKRSHPRRQFWYLTMRYLALLKNDPLTVMILLLQAPVIGIILYFLAASDVFNPVSIATCPQHKDLLANKGPIVSYNCQRIVDLLNSPQGTAFAQHLHQTKDQILQNAIALNSGVNAQTILFVMAFAAVLFGCINGVRAIVGETAIYRRERMVNLRIAPYMFSKIIVLGILSLIQALILVYIVNMKAPFQQGIFLPIFAEIYISIALTTLAGLMIGLALSSFAPSTDRAMSLIPLVLIPQVIFSGTIFELNTPFLQAIGALFATRWSIAALGSSIGLHANKLAVDNFSYRGTLFVSMNPASATPGAIQHLLIVWGALALMIILLALLVAYALKRKDVM